MQPATIPPAREYAATVYDPIRKTVLMFGGRKPETVARWYADTWTWDGTTWKDVTSSPSPSFTIPTAAFDSTANAVVALGLSDASHSMEMWSWDGSWHQLHPKVLPSIRTITTMAFDPQARRLIAFGGTNSVQRLSDTWAWDGATWTLLQPAHSPPPGRISAFLIELDSYGLLLCGGSDGFGSLTDVWGWDGTDWRQFQPSHALRPRGAVVSATGTPEGPLVLYTIDDSPSLQVWHWRNGDWTES
jgi:hypothetical protein